MTIDLQEIPAISLWHPTLLRDKALRDKLTYQVRIFENFDNGFIITRCKAQFQKNLDTFCNNTEYFK